MWTDTWKKPQNHRIRDSRSASSDTNQHMLGGGRPRVYFPQPCSTSHIKPEPTFKWSLWSAASENISSLLRIDSVYKCLSQLHLAVPAFYSSVTGSMFDFLWSYLRFIIALHLKTGQQIISSLLPQFWSGFLLMCPRRPAASWDFDHKSRAS